MPNYAGFFRACEMLSSQQIEGRYSYVKSSREVTGLEPTDQCLQMVQRMMDLDAARHYSRNWPGMLPLSPDSVDPNLAFLAIFSRDCRDFGVIYSDFGYRKQPISYLKIAQI
ncbi:hypothetical protein KFU94_00630 [Chloroflexi bacterium TSY]|nr:hypothetical protein [Chloroflexi bacterium TSY]